MKKLLIFSLIILFAYRTADVLSDIGLTRPQAEQTVFTGITSGYLSIPAACRKLAVSQRVTVVDGVVNFAKAYTKTDDFKKRYAAWRTDAKPTSDAKSYDQVQQEQKAQIAEMKKGLAETKASMAKLDAATQKAIQSAIQQQEKVISEMEASTSPMLMKRETVDQLNKYAEAEYQEKLKKWEAEYPADPATMIHKQLTAFIDQSAGVDFAAKLTDRNGKKYFVNPAYEQKSDTWKRCFRAGSEATASAQQLAKTWLFELEKK
ncbi:hypothetical protein GO730_23575 [Spirosoma sp. HMF3257]|uniref:DUF3826 domain-containing protein n=1 Tax=Spirosoma telluris TaxID=2183553 RepID=A0A327NPP5_9BACT|nr:hypothetical protein [Spirosoma telluris]RAI76389.1 hypothetical protein HMF3257_23505 [Spirosoma telluris]